VTKPEKMRSFVSSAKAVALAVEFVAVGRTTEVP